MEILFQRDKMLATDAGGEESQIQTLAQYSPPKVAIIQLK